ncbi:Zinc finger MYND-type [Trinorchestia longiramus]|nr:Zinc finger MYND-type [Trinorchestia longiramus]
MADDTTETGASRELKGSCAVCSKEATQRCANCRQVFYCRRECQREHWKKGHKNACKPFKVEQNSILGRYLVATRDFRAGDVIFKDDPLLVGPKQLTEPVCLGCYKRVDGSYRCRQCSWPMCGPACEDAPAHQPECVVGKIMGSPIEIADFNDVNHFYEVVTTLRGLALKKKSPKKYEELLSLESHFNDRKGTHIYNENQKRVVNMLRNYFMLVDFPPEEIDASEGSIHQMTGIIDTNAVDIPLADSEIVGIYPTFSMLEHSCTPNTKYRVSPSYQLTLKAAVNIKEGEHLSTIDTHILWGTAARRDHLKSTRFFMCTCRRCADPTELGTNFSALRCIKCPLGFLMSAAPLDQLADWICTSCNATITADRANEITLELGEAVEKILATGKVKEIEDLIEKSSSTVVHPNHFHLFAARHSLLQMLGRESPGLNEEAVKKKEKLCQEFLKTCTAIDPGMCKLASYVGVALYEYHLAVLARTREGPADRQVDKAALKKDLDTAKALLQQCIKVLQEEPPELPEGQLRLLAEQNLQELNKWESPNL